MIESIILSNLVCNEEFTRKVIPFIKPEYFSDNTDKIVFELINNYFLKYNIMPSKDALGIDLSNLNSITDEQFTKAKSIIEEFPGVITTDTEWLIDNTEKFCKDKAIYNGIMKSIEIMDDKSGKLAAGSIPKILSDALAVSFDTHVGHDYIDDSASRYDFYHLIESKVPFDIEFFNKVTNGGFSRKSLNLLMGGPGSGKSLIMCHMAANNLASGANVLYITMEMAEERIAERIDANLLDIQVKELLKLNRSDYLSRVDRIRAKTPGKLIIKEYATGSASASNFRYLLHELKSKKNFVPDIIYIDYLNICASSRIKMGSDSYSYVKAIAEELRGLAVENNVPVVSATQTNRSGFGSSDVDINSVSDSYGLPMTADFMCAIIISEEMDANKQIMIKIIKNRYADLNYCKRFLVGVDKSKMRLYNIEEDSQGYIAPDNIQQVAKFDKAKLSQFT